MARSYVLCVVGSTPPNLPLQRGGNEKVRASLKPPVAFSGCSSHGFAPMAELDIARHLTQWGLRRFTDEDSYYAWQRQSLAGKRLRLLQQAADARRDGEDADQVFYDLAASSDILPVLYSQRYDYYDVVALRHRGCIGRGTARVGRGVRGLAFSRPGTRPVSVT